jgi:methyl-accepting chemotaxis protein
MISIAPNETCMISGGTMKWFNNLSVSKKLIFGFSVVAALTALVGFVGISNIRKIEKADRNMYENATVPVVYAGYISRDYQRIRVGLRDILRTKEINQIERNKDLMRGYDKIISTNIVKIREASSLVSAENTKKIDELSVTYKAFYDLIMDIVEKYESGDLETVNRMMISDSTLKILGAIDKSVNEVFSIHEKYAEKLSKDNQQTSKYAVNFMIITVGVSVAVAFVMGVIIAFLFKAPIQKGLYFAQKIAEGDFTERIHIDQTDELGQLSHALNKSADSLEEMVSNIILNARSLLSATQDVSAGNENLSQRTSEQASALEEIAATIEQTTSSMRQNAENSEVANKLASETMQSAQTGGTVVSDAVKAINDINEESKKIEEITSVISEIAFQTNLLALNAAVEAARAGEQGRGFAVVAGEVRNLAQRSGASVKEIGDLLRSTIEKVERGTNLANKSGESLAMIIDSIKKLNRIVSEIAVSTDEQKQGASQINTAISELDQMTQQNAGLVEETSSASEEMAGQANELIRMMEKFKIREERKIV